MEKKEDPDSNNLRSITLRARSAFQVLFVTSVVKQVCLWLMTLVTIRLLAPTDYGIAGLVISLYPYLSLLTSLELSEWISQRKAFDERDQKAIFLLSLLLGIFFAGIAYAIGPLAAQFYEAPELVPIFPWVSVALLFQAVAFLPYSLLRRELNFKVLGWTSMFAGMLRAFLTLVLAFFGFGYWALVAGAIVESVVTTVVLVRIRGLPRGFAWNVGLYREALGFGLPATAAVACGVVFSTIDDIVIGKFFGIEVLGFYTMAYHLTDLPLTKINQLLNPLLVPYFGKLKESPEYLRSAFLKVVKFGVTLSAPVLVGLCVVVPVALPFLLGEKWAPAILPMQVMCLAVCFRGFVDKVSPLLLAIDKPQALLRIRGLTALVLTPSFVIFALLLGMNGIYLVWLAIYPLTMLYGLFVLRSFVAVSPGAYLVSLKAPICSAILLGSVVLMLTTLFSESLPASLLLVFQVLVGAFVYVGAFWLFFRADLFELVHICKQLLSRDIDPELGSGQK
jgi:O-antigen/teichoic acid export membrane protein